MILTQVLCPERAQLFFIMATAFISLCVGCFAIWDPITN